MGLSSLPGPSEGVLCVILVNTALSISLFKGILRSILHVVGIHLSSSPSSSPAPPSSSSSPAFSSEFAEAQTETYDFNMGSSISYVNEFRSRSPATRFDAVCSNCKQAVRECSVCLTEFEPESEINYLACGHFFHKLCLEKWLDYWNFTCPLCRSPVMPEEETRSCFW